MTDAELIAIAARGIRRSGWVQGNRWSPKGSDLLGHLQSACNGNPFTTTKDSRALIKRLQQSAGIDDLEAWSNAEGRTTEEVLELLAAPLDNLRWVRKLDIMDINDRMQVATQAGYGLLAKDDNQEIYGRGDLPSTLEFDGDEWTLHLRDFDFNPQGHQYLGDASLDPAHVFTALKTLDPNQLQDWML